MDILALFLLSSKKISDEGPCTRSAPGGKIQASRKSLHIFHWLQDLHTRSAVQNVTQPLLINDIAAVADAEPPRKKYGTLVTDVIEWMKCRTMTSLESVWNPIKELGTSISWFTTNYLN